MHSATGSLRHPILTSLLLWHTAHNVTCPCFSVYCLLHFEHTFCEMSGKGSEVKGCIQFQLGLPVQIKASENSTENGKEHTGFRRWLHFKRMF